MVILIDNKSLVAATINQHCFHLPNIVVIHMRLIEFIVALGSEITTEPEQIVVVMQYNWHWLNNAETHYLYYCLQEYQSK